MNLSQHESNCSEVELGDQMEASHLDEVEPETLAAKKMDAPSSLVVEEDEDVSYNKGPLCNPLAPAEPKDCLTEDKNARVATEVCHFALISILKVRQS